MASRHGSQDLRHRPLFRDAGLPSIQDVKQGKVGDCWAMASFAALARFWPRFLTGIVRYEPDGYSVLLDSGPVLVPPLSHVHQRLPGVWTDSFAGTGRAAWVSVLEQALAIAGTPGAAAPTYESLHGGTPALAFERLAGEEAVESRMVPPDTEPRRRQEVYQQFAEFIGTRPVVATMRQWTGTPHAYAVIAREAGGIRLYDPYGEFVVVPEAEFVKRFGFAVWTKSHDPDASRHSRQAEPSAETDPDLHDYDIVDPGP